MPTTPEATPTDRPMQSHGVNMEPRSITESHDAPVDAPCATHNATLEVRSSEQRQ